MAAVFSRGLRRLPHLAAFLAVDHILFQPQDRQAGEIGLVVGWGCKPNTGRARDYARRHGLPYLHLEDGFLRSVDLGARSPPLSIVLDDLGIYYDSTRPSRLEAWLNGEGGDALADPELIARAGRCLRRVVEARLSKYNHAPDGPMPWAEDGRRRVLVVDQTAGDLSVVHGSLHPGGFAAMLQAALDEHPDAEVVVKTHPDVLAGRKRGCLGALPASDRIRVIARDLNPQALLAQVDHVFVATSQMGFEALMAGKRVSCFGTPFYAGWGLTDDRIAIASRGRARSLEQVFAAAYILYPRYLDPETGERCEIERVIEHLALQRRWFARNAGTKFCFGFTPWKRGFVRAYLRSPQGRTLFVRSAAQARRLGFDANSRIVAWGHRDGKEVERLAREYGVAIERMEDGFLRSGGLGSDYTAPASLVLDARGIYYDPGRASDLEVLLETTAFSEELLARARRLQAGLLGKGISKYNVGRRDGLELDAAPGRKVILVPGQVEDDASVVYGGGAIATNRRLLELVRERKPEAYIVYKPHPDVVSGNRKGAVPRAVTAELCDRVVEDVGLHACLARVDEVHTLTSLVGFEALMRGLPVYTYGLPFYAGWGLTRDYQSLPRRQRRLCLDELVAGVLILYPRYLHPGTRAFSEPEAIVAWLDRVIGREGERLAAYGPWSPRRLRRLRDLWAALRW